MPGIDELLDPLRLAEFRSGLGVGMVALGIIGILGFVFGRRRRVPLGGIAIAFATLLAPELVDGLPARVLTAATFLGVGGLVLDRWHRRPLAWPVAAALGGTGLGILAAAGEDARATAAIVGCVVIGVVLGLHERHRRSVHLPVWWLVSTGGAYATLPDTEHVLVLFGASAALTLAVAPPLRVRFGVGGALAATGVAGSIIAVDGVGRTGAMVGATGCYLAITLRPVWVRLRPRLSSPRLLGVHVVVVLWSSRVAGLRTDGRLAAVLFLLGLAIIALLLGSTKHQRRRL